MRTPPCIWPDSKSGTWVGKEARTPSLLFASAEPEDQEAKIMSNEQRCLEARGSLGLGSPFRRSGRQGLEQVGCKSRARSGTQGCQNGTNQWLQNQSGKTRHSALRLLTPCAACCHLQTLLQCSQTGSFALPVQPRNTGSWHKAMHHAGSIGVILM